MPLPASKSIRIVTWYFSQIFVKFFFLTKTILISIVLRISSGYWIILFFFCSRRCWWLTRIQGYLVFAGNTYILISYKRIIKKKEIQLAATGRKNRITEMQILHCLPRAFGVRVTIRNVIKRNNRIFNASCIGYIWPGLTDHHFGMKCSNWYSPNGDSLRGSSIQTTIANRNEKWKRCLRVFCLAYSGHRLGWTKRKPKW